MVTPTPSFIVREIGWHNRPGRCFLYKEELSARTFCCAPLLNAALQRPQLRVGTHGCSRCPTSEFEKEWLITLPGGSPTGELKFKFDREGDLEKTGKSL